MDPSLDRQLALLPRLTVHELRRRYAEAFGEPTAAHNRVWLIKRIAWRLQALVEGDLSERARRRAAELANDADLRLNPPKAATPAPPAPAATPAPRPGPDPRLPPPGSILTRPYKGDTLQVLVLADGFEFEGGKYRSLSAVAKVITGSHCNGFWFFGLTTRGGDQ